VKVERISAITLRVASMRTSVQFYRDVLGMEIIYGGEDGFFSSLRTKGANDPILNLEEGAFGDSVGAADLLRAGRGSILDVLKRTRFPARESSRRLMGRTVFSYV